MTPEDASLLMGVLGVLLLFLYLLSGLLLRDEAISIAWAVDQPNGGTMEIKSLDIEVGATTRVHLVGKTKTGAPHALENVTAAVAQNPEAFTVAVEGTDLVVTCIAAGAGGIAVTADGRIGDGVRPISKLLPCNGHEADAVDLAFVTDDEPAPVVEEPTPTDDVLKSFKRSKGV